MKTNFSLLITLAVLTVGACSQKADRLSYELTTLEPATISNTVTATGTVEPITQVEVGTQVSGIISKIYVDYNSEVKAGQLIAEIDRSVLATELEASQANLNSAKTEYEYQTSNYNRLKGLFDKDLISASEFEQAEYSYNKANYSYTQAKANIKKAEKNIKYTEIYSPIDGVVLDRAVDEGQTVAAGFSTPTLFTIANDLRKMQVIANVDEADIGEVQVGQIVKFTVDAYPQEVFEGSVLQVRLQATTTSNVVTYEVVIDAPNPGLKLKPGLTASVNIYTLNLENIVAVPIRALRFTPEGITPDSESPCVWIMDAAGKPQARKVVTGLSDGIYTEICQGLSFGEQVITGTSLATASPKKQDIPQGSDQNSNPFMPKRPGQGSNVRTK